jgi:hypothetical protein
MNLELHDTTLMALSSDSLPMVPPTLANWPQNELQIIGDGFEIYVDLNYVASSVESRTPGASTPMIQINPNPFGERTTAVIRLPQRARTTVDVWSVTGRRVRILVEGQVLQAGMSEVSWDGVDQWGSRAPTGVYFLRVITPTSNSTRRLVLIR